MAPRQVTDTYFVSPQIEAGDVPALKEAGISLIICNRPDEEIPPALQAEAIGAAAAEAGIAFEVLPLTHQTMTPENVGRQKALIAEADGLVLAYCASGTRSTVVWALGMAGELSADEILNKAAAAGYDLAGLRGALG